MKEKISTALKTKYANLGLSQKAFDGVAAFLIAQKTIEKEEDIASAIEGGNVKDLLKVFQSETDTIRTAKSAAEKALEDYKEAHPESKPNDTDVETETAKALRELKEKQEAFEQRVKEEDARRQRETVISGLGELMKSKGSTNDFIRNTILKDIAVAENDTAESLLDKAQALYDTTYTAAYGKSPVPPAGGPQSGEYKPGAFASEVERLKASGKLPSE